MTNSTGNEEPSTNPVTQVKFIYVHYVWVVVAIIAGMQMVGASLRMAFGVLIDPLTTTFGWSQGSITLAYAITAITTALVSPFAGMFGDRYGARRSMALGVVLFVIGASLTALVREAWHLYLTFGVILGVAQALFLVPLIPAGMSWFRRRLGVGIGIIMGSRGMGPAIGALIIGFLVQKLGWQQGVLAIAIGGGIIMAIMTLFFRNRPSDVGVLPYGARPGDPIEAKGRPDKEKVKLYAGFMRKTTVFWNMCSIHFLGCVGHAVIIIYIVPLAVNEGISVVAAAGLLTVMSGVSVLTRMATPILSDNFGAKPVMATAYVLQALPVIMLFWTHDLWLFYVFAATFGVGYGGESGGFPILNRRYFGHAPIGSAHGSQMLGAGLGMALGGWIGGPIFDMTGSYHIALMISIGASLFGMVGILMLEPTKRLLIPDWDVDNSPTGTVPLPTPAGGDD